MIEPAALRTWMIDYICSVLALDAATFSTSATFDSYGLDSVEAVLMAGLMEEEFGVQIDPVRLFEAPSVDLFVKSMTDAASPAPDSLEC